MQADGQVWQTQTVQEAGAEDSMQIALAGSTSKQTMQANAYLTGKHRQYRQADKWYRQAGRQYWQTVR